MDLALAGKALLILGGAFLLRAATESATLPKHAGVILGLLYAAAWIAYAVFSASAGRRAASLFTAGAAAFIAYPIVWEATTRFGVLTAPMAAALLALFGVTLIAAARVYSMPSLAWIAAAGATIDALLLAFATKQLVPFLLALTLIGVAALALSMKYVGWLLAIESDLFAIVLIAMTLLDEKKPAPLAWLTLFALAWLLMPGIPAVSGALIGFGGAAAIVMMRGTPAAATAIIALIAGAVLYGLALRDAPHPRSADPLPARGERVLVERVRGIAAGICALSGSLILLPSAFRAVAWGLAALAAAEVARRRSSQSFAIQSVTWGSIAAVASIPIAAPFCFVAFLRRRNVVLLAIAMLPLVQFVGIRPLLLTIILAAASLALAVAGRWWQVREASQLAIVGLIATGAQVAAQVLRSGNAGMMFIALAVYGGAMLGIARLRRTAATT